MDIRSALPIAVMVGTVIGVGAVANDAMHPDQPRTSSFSLVAEAEAALPVTWDIPFVRNEHVERFVDLFEGRQSELMASYLKKSGRYEGMIRAKLRERDMPEDLVYLSMIESGFNPTARSRANAVGLWQFMEETGRDYGLRIDSYVDERRDPEKSTDAALHYLTDLHDTFGSWYLAAAAYNAGAGRVGRDLKAVTGRSRATSEADFWKIRWKLPKETREYVPLMLAAALISKEPQKYGLGDVPRWLPIDMDTVKVPGGTPLAVIARSTGVDAGEVGKMNPQLVKKITPPGKPYTVQIPQGRGAEFSANFDREYSIEMARIEKAAAEARAAEKVARARQVARERAARARRASSASRRTAGRASSTKRGTTRSRRTTRRH